MVRMINRMGIIGSCRNIRMISSIRIGDVKDEQIGEITARINRERLWRDLHETCQWGRGEIWGTYVFFGSFQIGRAHV